MTDIYLFRTILSVKKFENILIRLNDASDFLSLQINLQYITGMGGCGLSVAIAFILFKTLNRKLYSLNLIFNVLDYVKLQGWGLLKLRSLISP